MYDNTFKTDSDSTDYCLLQTSLLVPTLETTIRYSRLTCAQKLTGWPA